MKLDDRMALYESQTTSRKLIPRLPVLVRLDGKNFSKFTKGLKKPYDERLSKLMIETTKYMVKLTNANAGYTGSDEITLVFYSDNVDNNFLYDGKIYKLESYFAAICSVFFYSKLPEYLPEKQDILTTFDARVWNAPTLEEAANSFLSRERATTKNSISIAAETEYSSSFLKNKNGSEKQELLFQKGINWNDYPAFYKRGTYIQKKVKKGKIDLEDIQNLPEKHAARTNPNLEITRNVVIELDLPPLDKISNKVDVLIFGKDYIYEKT